MTTAEFEALRAYCQGVSPLPGRLEPWQVEALNDPAELARLIEEHGSPVNLISPELLDAHAGELTSAARGHGVTARVFFARKANKALGLVDAALAGGHGVDVASEGELSQVIARGAGPDDVIVSAAVKPRRLLARAVEAGVVISIDNLDELALLSTVAAELGRVARIALRCAPQDRGVGVSRFGLSDSEVRGLLHDGGAWSGLSLEGLHFHLSGYDARQRASVLDRVLDLHEVALRQGHEPWFVDIGGGVPMRYLESEKPWLAFWEAHHEALRGDRPSMFWSEHTLGLGLDHGRVTGTPAVYPMWQDPIRGDWLDALLATPSRHEASLGERLRTSGVALHLEPGRSLLDGGGMTVARVESRKRTVDGTWYVGTAMNRTQVRSAADDFLLDPILIPTGSGERTEPVEGYLVGAYCIEADLLTHRRMAFPHGVAVGDLVVFVNTAGYLMHILESASHQIPLARNLLRTPRGWELDDIDR